jgi:hypothetical protein
MQGYIYKIFRIGRIPIPLWRCYPGGHPKAMLNQCTPTSEGPAEAQESGDREVKTILLPAAALVDGPGSGAAGKSSPK